ncbi:hypothetical protein ABNG02_03265 [Halorubrum ejinorense]|uniref:DUF7260 domain-containing protein n=1 Tax=Halorubrum ejinorense TaxID=425309 RepID=A0AAV3SWI2_9EURY
MTATRTGEADDPVRAALAALRVERRRTVDERQAFETFRDRVSSIPDESGSVDPSTAGPANGGGGASGGVDRAVGGGAVDAFGDALGRGTDEIGDGVTAAAGSGLVAVRDAYRATVMSVPHYEVEYDDTYERSVAAEFGPEMAYALTRTTNFRAEYKRSLLTAASTAIEERESFLDAVESEVESVSRAGSRLDPVRSEVEAIRDELGGGDERDEERDGDADRNGHRAAPTFGALDACRTRTEALRDDCDRIAARRQRAIADSERRLALDDGLDLPAYCYQDLDATYPVLAAVGAVGADLDALRRRIERSMGRAR